MHPRQTTSTKEPGIQNRSNWFGRRTGTTGTPSELSWFACLDALGALVSTPRPPTPNDVNARRVKRPTRRAPAQLHALAPGDLGLFSAGPGLGLDPSGERSERRSSGNLRDERSREMGGFLEGL